MWLYLSLFCFVLAFWDDSLPPSACILEPVLTTVWRRSKTLTSLSSWHHAFLGCDKLAAFQEELHCLLSDVRWPQWNNTESFPEVITTGLWAFGVLQRYIQDNCWAVFHRGNWGQGQAPSPQSAYGLDPPASPYFCHHRLLSFLLAATLTTFTLFSAVLTHTFLWIATSCLYYKLDSISLNNDVQMSHSRLDIFVDVSQMCFLAVIHIYYKSHCKSFDSLYMSLLPVAILIANAVLCAGCVVCGYSEISSSPDLSLNLLFQVLCMSCIATYIFGIFF